MLLYGNCKGKNEILLMMGDRENEEAQKQHALFLESNMKEARMNEDSHHRGQASSAIMQDLALRSLW